MNEMYKEAVETIEENLMTVFDTNFNQKHKEKLDCIFEKLKESPEISDKLTEIISELEWTFYNHGRATEKLIGGLE
jgi:hypothetical protein